MARHEVGQTVKIKDGYNEWWTQHNPPHPRRAAQAIHDGDIVVLLGHTGPHWWVKRAPTDRATLMESRWLESNEPG